MAEYILKLNGISKSFPGVRALDGVTFGVEKGTIHALVGENGAGKSTLIKILAGIYHTSEGSIFFDGKENVTFKAPVDSRNAGIAVVHQEIKLAEPLTVAENMFIGNLIYTKSGLVDRIAWEFEGTETVYRLTLQGDAATIYELSASVSDQLVLTQPGDRVELKFVPAEEETQNCTEFTNLSMR